MFLQKTKVTKKRPDAKPLFCAAAHRPFGRGTPVPGGGDGQKYAFFTDRPNVSHKKGYLCGYGTSCETGAGSHRSAARCVCAAHAAAFAAARRPLGRTAAGDRGVPFGGALRRGGRRMRPGIAHPRVVRRAVGPQGVDRGCRGRCRSPRNGGGAGPRGRRTGTCGGCRGGRSPADLEPCAGGRAGAMGFEEAATTVFAIKTDAE